MRTAILSCATALMALTAIPAGAVSGGGFSVSIQNNVADYNGYVRMRHGQVYAVCFANNLDRRADAEVNIDGLSMGTWRLKPNQRACVERPATTQGRFTFYRADSSEGYAVGSGQVNRGDKGKLSVAFYPEVERSYAYEPEPYNGYSRSHSDAAPEAQGYAAPRAQKRAPPSYDNLNAGVTGLTGHSDQRFRHAGQIERDYAQMVRLELRLVHDPAYDTTPAEPRPLPGRYYRPAPPPIGY